MATTAPPGQDLKAGILRVVLLLSLSSMETRVLLPAPEQKLEASAGSAHAAGDLEAQPSRYLTPAWYEMWFEALTPAVKTTVG